MPDPSALEIARLQKIVQALMDRAEGTAAEASDFGLFQTTAKLEEQVRSRTAELQAANRALQESEARFRAVVNQSLVGIVTIDDGRFTYTNARFDEMFGYTSQEMRELGPGDLVLDADRPLVEDNLRLRVLGFQDQVNFTYRGFRKDGEVIDVECHGSSLDLGGSRLLISVLQDVTERTRAENEVRALQKRLREQATHDDLTGLYNRRFLQAALDRELVLARREGHVVSVIMSDVDRFKAVNDDHGHLAGDEVLRVFGSLILRSARASDICCRYGGEEFLLVMPRMTKDDAATRADDLRRLLRATPVLVDDSVVNVTASFGVAVFPDDADTSDELIGAADDALYAAKRAGRDRVRASSGGRPPLSTQITG